MEIKKFIVTLKCPRLGRGFSVMLDRYSDASSFISVRPYGCPHNAGSSDHRCLSPCPLGGDEAKEAGKETLCPYNFDYPETIKSSEWQIPPDLAEAIFLDYMS